MSDLNETTKCHLNFSDAQATGINLAMSITGGVGVLMAAIILVVLLATRSFKTTLQRLFICTTIALLTQESCHLINLVPQLVLKKHGNLNFVHHFCKPVGILTSWSSWTTYSYYYAMMLYLLILIVGNIGKATRYKNFILKLTNSNKPRFILEFFCVIGPVVLPGLVLYPLLYRKNAFGFSHAYCWIKKNAWKEGLIFDIVFYEAAGFVEFVIVLVIMISSCSLSIRLPAVRKITFRFLALLLSCLLYMMVINGLLVVEIKCISSYPFEICFAISATVCDFFFLTGYFLTMHYSKLAELIRLQPTKLREYGTFEKSNRQSMPSYTKSITPLYTGGFTSVNGSP